MRSFIILIISVFVINTIFAQQQVYNNKIVVKINNNGLKSGTINNIRNTIGDELKDMYKVFKTSTLKQGNIPKQYYLGDIYKIEIKEKSNINSIIYKLQKLDNVVYAELYPISVILDDDILPNDSLINNQYYLENIKAVEAHKITTGDTNIVIGIVDTGVDLLHEDLKDNYKYNYNDPINNIDDDMDGYVDNYYGWDIASNDNNPQSIVSYHGTRVAGMASAVSNNKKGIYSIGYKVKILPIKVMDEAGNISTGYEGIVYAADHGCDIINCSWGSNTPSKFAQDVVNYATEYRHCLIIASAGNKKSAIDKRPDTWWYPASYDNVLSVAATGQNDVHWNGTSFATTVDVSAPGENVYSTYKNSSYAYGWGTSFASPIVAGLAGLLKTKFPNYTPQQLAAQIRITSDNIDTIPENEFYEKQLGYGRVNAFNALTKEYAISINIDSVKISTKKDGAKDILSVTFSATNILSQVTNTTIRLTINTNNITPINNILKTGELKTFESINNLQNPFNFEINEDMPYNKKVWLTFEMKGEGYDDYKIVETVLNKNYINITKNNIEVTVSSNGRLGFANIDDDMGVGLVYKINNNFIKHGGIILGLNNTQVVSEMLDVNEFNIITKVDSIRKDNGNVKIESKFKPIESKNIPVDILQTTEIDNEQESTIIYTYSIFNKGATALTDIKFAQFIDWDLYSANQNKVSYNKSLNLFYTKSLGTKVVYAGICLINNMEAVPYGFDLIEGGNGGIDITKGFSDELKWVTMTNNRESAGNNGDSINVASMLSTDYFTIKAEDTVNVIFANIIADSYNDLVSKTISVINKYNDVAISDKILKDDISIYPNPTQNSLYITNKLENSKINVKIYSVSGNIYIDKTYNSKVVEVNVKNLPSGTYIIYIQTDDTSEILKFIKL